MRRIPETSLGGPSRAFPSTSWGLVLRAGDPGDPAYRESLADVVRRYWKPVYGYIRALRGRGVEDAKDLTQEFFARLLEKGLVERADPQRGNFRGLLKRSAHNFVIDAGRREHARRPPSGVLVLPFDECRDEENVRADRDPDEVFADEWSRAVLAEAMEELRRRLQQRGIEGYYEVFRAYCFPEANDSSDAQAATYRDVAERLGLSEAGVRKRLARCRTELRAIVLEKIREYAWDETEVAAEYRAVLDE